MNEKSNKIRDFEINNIIECIIVCCDLSDNFLIYNLQDQLFPSFNMKN